MGSGPPVCNVTNVTPKRRRGWLLHSRRVKPVTLPPWPSQPGPESPRAPGSRRTRAGPPVAPTACYSALRPVAAHAHSHHNALGALRLCPGMGYAGRDRLNSAICASCRAARSAARVEGGGPFVGGYTQKSTGGARGEKRLLARALSKKYFPKFSGPHKALGGEKFLLREMPCPCYISGMTNIPAVPALSLEEELLGGKISAADEQFPDGPIPPAPDPTQELEVKPDAQPSRVQALDEVHATSKGGGGYALTIAGLAYTQDVNKNKINVPYRVVIKVAKLEGAISLLRKIPANGGDSYLDAVVRKAIGPSFRGVRTYNPEGAEPLNDKTPAPKNLQFMSIDQLKAVVKERGIAIKLEDYGNDVVALRESVMDSFLNPKDFPIREAKRSADRAERSELERLNAA